MDNKLEKRITQHDIDATPKPILEEFFNYMDEKRIKYEEKECKYHKQISTYQVRIQELNNALTDPDELTVKEIKAINEYIKTIKQEIIDAKREIRLIHINCNILWKNELKADKILGYGLEE